MKKGRIVWASRGICIIITDEAKLFVAGVRLNEAVLRRIFREEEEAGAESSLPHYALSALSQSEHFN